MLDVVGSFLPGTPPASDASAAKVATYFRDHSSGIKAQLLIGGLGIAALMWWFGTLWRMLSRAEGERPRLAIVAAVSLVTGLVLALVSSAINSAVAIHPADVATTYLFFSFSLIVIAAGGLGIGVFLLAACTVTYRAGLTPRWVSYVGWAAGVAVPCERPRNRHRLGHGQPAQPDRLPHLVRLDHRGQRLHVAVERLVAGAKEPTNARLDSTSSPRKASS